ncbi:hypothetical protein KSP39_PZI019837 [Platanthera zijinensis]|uniref:Peptidase S9A N-terminal domain-containing protein n=1 Tax=Platanthera zijinensis TaxID=2320716 RepID=A0AAP0FXZ0_9ASPA
MPGLSRSTLFPLLLVTSWLLVTSYAWRIHATAAQSFSSNKVIPPVAKKARHEMEMFGDVRVDDYYWLRDDSHSNREILSYLKAENDYTNQSMSSVKQFEDQLYAEMVARTKEEVGISAPIRRGSYYYYERTLVGKDNKLHCRRLITNDASPPSVYDVMPTGPEAPTEHVILDENIRAQGHEYYYLGAFRPSPNNKLIAYAEDTKGDGIHTVYVIDADKGTAIGNPLKGVTSNIEWAGDDALVYITMDESHRYQKTSALDLKSAVRVVAEPTCAGEEAERQSISGGNLEAVRRAMIGIEAVAVALKDRRRECRGRAVSEMGVANDT